MNDIHDIHGPVQVGIDPLIVKLTALVAAGILLIVLLFFLVRRLMTRRKQVAENLLMLPPPLPPFEQAMRALDQLGARRFADLRWFYFELTAILKRYTGAAYGINAPEMTSQEFSRALAGLDIDCRTADRLSDLINASDQVKYAGDVPAEEMIRQDLSRTGQVIRDMETRRQPGEARDV